MISRYDFLRTPMRNIVTTQHLLTALVFALVWGPMPSAMGLDSSRRLTQALHRIWQTQQGLPQSTPGEAWGEGLAES